MIQKLSYINLKRELRELKDPKRANFLARYFKTGKGQYAEGDIFLGGIITANASKISKKYQTLPIKDVEKLLRSKYHEERSVALGILCLIYKKAEFTTKKKIYNLYLKNTEYINNWDLVDISADKIIGNYIIENPKEIKVLYKLCKSKSLWDRRISIMSTFAFIKIGNFDKTLEISARLLKDKEDLIHKAAGWMLREVGKRNRKVEEIFLRKYGKIMPRTMFRYALEKFPGDLRKKYMNM